MPECVGCQIEFQNNVKDKNSLMYYVDLCKQCRADLTRGQVARRAEEKRYTLYSAALGRKEETPDPCDGPQCKCGAPQLECGCCEICDGGCICYTRK
jgi:hypothetical protein